MLGEVKVEFKSRKSSSNFPGFIKGVEWVVIRERIMRVDEWDMFRVEIRSSNFGSGIFDIFKYGRMSSHSKGDNEGRSMGYSGVVKVEIGSRNSSSNFPGFSNIVE